MPGLDSDIAPIRRIGAFARLADDALNDLLLVSDAMTFTVGESIMRQSEPGDSAYVVVSGDLVVVNEDPHGEAVLARFPGPALVGEVGAIAGVPRTATVRAASPVRALRLERQALVDVCHRNPDMLVSIVAQLARQLQNVNHALGLYAAGFEALERDEFDPALFSDLDNPTPELRAFAAAFHRVADRIVASRENRAT